MKYSLSKSIRTQLLALVLISILPALGIVLHSGLEIERKDHEEARNDARRIVRMLAYDHDRAVESTRQFLVALARFPEVRSQDVDSCNRLFGELLKENPLYANIFALTAEGWFASSAVPFTPQSLKERKYFQDVLRTKDFSVGEYVVGAAVKVPVLHFAYPVIGSGGEIKGIVGVALDLSRYGDLFNIKKLPQGSRVTLSDHQGKVLFCSPDLEKYIGKTHSPDTITRMSSQSDERVFVGPGPDGIQCLFGCKRFYLKGNSSPYLFLQVGIPEEQALAPAKTELIFNLGLFGGGLLAAMALAWFLGKVLIVRRLRTLVDASQRLSHGDFQARTRLKYSQDELGVLTKTFDEMAGELENKETQRRLAVDALRESERDYRNLYDDAPVGYHELDAQGHVIRINKKELEMLGYTAEEVLGQPIWNFVTQKQEAEDLIKAKLAGTVPPSEGLERTYWKKDGTVVSVLIDDVVVRGEDGRIVGLRSTIQDITDRKRMETELRESEKNARRLADENRILGEIGRIINSSLNIEEVYDQFAQELRKLIPFDRISINRVNHKDNTISIDYFTGLETPGLPRGAILPLAKSLGGYILSTRKSLLVRTEEIEDYARKFPSISPSLRAGIKSLIGVPLISKGEGIGILFIRSTGPDAYSERELRLAEQVGYHMTSAVANSRLFAEQKRAEGALRTSEEKFRKLFEDDLTGDYITTGDGIILDCNPAFLEMFRYKNKVEALGERITELYPEPPERDSILDQLRATGKLENYEATRKRKDGSLITTNENLVATVGENGDLVEVKGYIYDISDRKRAEEEQLKLQTQLAKAMEMARLGPWEYDVANDLFTFNDHFYRIFGTTAEQLGGYTMSSAEYARRFVHPDDMAVVGEEIRKSKEATDPNFSQKVEHRMLYTDGTVGYISVNIFIVKDSYGNTIRTYGVNQDVTERKRAEEALRENEEKYRTLVEGTTDWVWAIDAAGVHTYSNNAIVESLGYSAAEVIGTSAFPMMHPVDAEHWGPKRSECIARKAGWRKEPIRWLDKKGDVHHFESSASPVLDATGEVVGFRGIDRDITERKQSEEEREKLQAQLLQAQKMESVGRLAGGVAHDFNNMLGIIIGNAEMAALQVKPPDPVYQSLQEILKASHRSADTVRQLLAFARKQTISPKVLDLNDTVSGMLKMLQRLIGEDIDLAWVPGHELWSVKIDPSQVNQILANLAVNARDAIAGVGKVTIETDNVTFDEVYCATHEGFLPGEYVLLAVSDSGSGMPKEVLEHLFEPFFTTKGVGKGTGLGLSTIYGIVKQNNGFVNVYSEVGEGTTFKIYFPRLTSVPVQTRVEREPEKLPRGTETVLMVEDEDAILRIGKAMLEELGYRVLTAATPREAIRLIGEHGRAIQLLITDVVMPEMNGRDLEGRLKAVNPDLKCLYMSGYTANVIAHHGVLDEGVVFIQKPFSTRELAVKVREVLD